MLPDFWWFIAQIPESNRLKYRHGSGSSNLIFNGSVPVQVQDFSKIWVQVHRFEMLKVRFRFNDLKFKWFKFGSGSPKKKRFGFGSSACYPIKLA